MATVPHWTGLEDKALRGALHLSVRAFTQQLGLAVATVSKWESKLADTAPRPDTQAILDTALSRASASVHLHFETLLPKMASSSPSAGRYRAGTQETDKRALLPTGRLLTVSVISR